METGKDMLLVRKLRMASHKTRAGKRGGPHGPGGPFPPAPPHGPGHRPGGPMPLPRERILMVVLEGGDDGLRQKDIAAKMGINAPALTEQIDRLESEGYLERRVNPDDKRSTLVRLTELGRARADEVADEEREAAAAFCRALSEEEKDVLISLLDKLLEKKEPEV